MKAVNQVLTLEHVADELISMLVREKTPFVLDRKKLADQKERLQDILANIKYPIQPDFLPFKDGVYFFDIVTDTATLLEAFRLRFLAYSDAPVGYIKPEQFENFPLGIEFDKYDGAAFHFYARSIETGRLCGNLRYIEDTPLGLQIDENLDISAYRGRYRLCEMSRMIHFLVVKVKCRPY